MSTDLAARKAKMYDVVHKLGTAEREKVLTNVEDMYMLIEDMAARIDQLNRERVPF